MTHITHPNDMVRMIGHNCQAAIIAEGTSRNHIAINVKKNAELS